MAGRMKVDVGRLCTPDGYLRGNSAHARAPLFQICCSPNHSTAQYSTGGVPRNCPVSPPHLGPAQSPILSPPPAE